MAGSGFSARQQPLVVICGATASGKTALALEVARHFPIEIISADSRQVYRGMDIGTAKATQEERSRVAHHLIDVVNPDEEFTVARFVALGHQAAFTIADRTCLPVVVGGTGLYIKALTEGLVDAPGGDESVREHLVDQERLKGEGTLYRLLQEHDPEMAIRLSPNDRVRIVRALEVFHLTGRPLSELQSQHGFSDNPFRILKIGLNPDREVLYGRIDQRVNRMIHEGLVDEVKGLLSQGYGSNLKSMQAIGYREIIAYLQGRLSSEEAVGLIQRESRRYAKRQLTWFRRDPAIIWVDSLKEFGKIHELIECFYAAS